MSPSASDVTGREDPESSPSCLGSRPCSRRRSRYQADHDREHRRGENVQMSTTDPEGFTYSQHTDISATVRGLSIDFSMNPAARWVHVHGSRSYLNSNVHLPFVGQIL